jgi:cation diffusion facilitator CzcD-associated flavoprotein CzcO
VTSPENLRFVVIGAGMSGILSAIRLQEAGYDDFVLYEKADRLGGTWRENRYPGLACDVPSHLYSYSFAPNPDWSHRFSPGPEILAYFEDVARRYGVVERIRFGQQVVRCSFEDGRWSVETADGTRDRADFVIAATGVLHHPSMPDIEGLDDFEGTAFHSARWPDGLKLEGRRVGVVGAGSTAIQIASAVVDQVSELVLFQRTPQWVMQVDNPAFSENEKANFRAHPEAMAALRQEVARSFTEGFANVLVDADAPELQAIQEACEANLEHNVADPVLREKLRPTDRAACKRLIMSPDYYDAVQRPNARVVTERIERVEKSGVRTIDGRLHELDVLVLATGFRVDQFVRPMTVVGQGGAVLDEVWKEGPFAYMSISVPDFPNFFLLNGPNSPVGNFPLIEVAERQLDYVLQLVEQVRAGACRSLAASRAAMARFDAERREAARHTIWASGCRSWYLDRSGLPTAWPWTMDRFHQEMSAARLDDYEMR